MVVPASLAHGVDEVDRHGNDGARHETLHTSGETAGDAPRADPSSISLEVATRAT